MALRLGYSWEGKKDDCLSSYQFNKEMTWNRQIGIISKEGIS